MLIAHREPGVKEGSLPQDYQRIITAVRQTAGPVTAREVGEVGGVNVSVKAKLEPLRSKRGDSSIAAGCGDCPTAASPPVCGQEHRHSERN
ncbi:hypothetical protein ACIGD1_32640 [Streptomyces sp. NPDC085612]|uniref:hypothetical protein n=1 Tax=Streptomyces sp. NPDC085612 TaxID=3365732 RepID=UPI0037D1E4CB